MKKSQRILIAAALSSTLLLSGCDDSHHDKDYHYTDNAKEYYGIWEHVGYGTIRVINREGAQSFEHTRETCIKLPFVNNAELDNNLIDKKLSRHKDSFSALPMAEAVFRHYFTRLNKLPEKCEADRLITVVTPVKQFEHFWHNFNDYYAFFDKRGVDWQQQYTTYYPRINDGMSQEALFNVFSDMLAPIDDGHISLTSSDDSFSPAQPANITMALRQAFQQQSEISDFGDYANAQLDNIQQVQSTYLYQVTQAGGPDDEVAAWGRVDGNNIGYLQLNRMAGIDSDVDLSDLDTVDAEKDLVAIQAIMQQVVNDFTDVDALLIDLRLNTGGSDHISLAIANYFTLQHQLAVSKYTNNWQGRTRNVEAYLNPTQQQLHVPIALLSSDMTASAAEIFLMAMRSIPEVSVVGEPSSGELSDTLSKALSDDMDVDLSNEIYLDHAGHNYEVSGVPVDISTTAFDLDGFSKGKDTALDAAIDYLTTKIQ